MPTFVTQQLHVGCIAEFRHTMELNSATWDMSAVTPTVYWTSPAGVKTGPFTATFYDAPNGVATYTNPNTLFTTSGYWFLQWHLVWATGEQYSDLLTYIIAAN